MLTQTSAPPLEQTLETHIQRCSWGQVRGLHIERVGDRVVVQGRTQTFYQKQLALRGVLEALGSVPTDQVQIDIQVGGSHLRAM